MRGRERGFSPGGKPAIQVAKTVSSNFLPIVLIAVSTFGLILLTPRHVRDQVRSEAIAPVPSAHSKLNAFFYLAIAMAVSVVLAFPNESAQHDFRFGTGSYWNEHSCGTAVTLLNRGLIVQAILTPLFLFLLPGTGSLIGSRSSRAASLRPAAAASQAGAVANMLLTFVLLIVCPLMLLRSIFFLWHIPLESSTLVKASVLVKAAVMFEMAVEAAAGALGTVAAIYLLRKHVTGGAARFFAAGWLFAAAVPIVWWYGLKGYAAQQGLCEDLFTVSRPVDFLRIDDLYDSYRYYLYLAVFSTMWVGTAAAGLRLLSAREAEAGSTSSELRSFREFFWVYLLGWAVQYRLGCLSTVPSTQNNQAMEWLTWSFVSFLDLTASCLWALAFVRWFWKWRVRAWWASVAVAFAGPYVICILTMISFFWLVLYAPMALLPLGKGKVWGWLWALTVGTWRWQALRHRPRWAAASGRALPQQATAAVSAGSTLPQQTAAAAAGPALPQQPAAAPAAGQEIPREQPAALAGLKAFQIVAVAVGVFLLLALLYAAVALYIVMHQRSLPHYP